MESSSKPRRLVIEVIDDDMARVIQAKSGAERLAIANDLYSNARKMLIYYLQVQNPNWDEKQVIREAARRLSHGAV
jgi:hypothetical protein